MGIFDFFNKNKRKDQQNEQCLLDEEGTGEADLWSKAYVAEPQCYEKEGKEKLLSFVITEGVNTILPMYPNELYKSEEENFSDIRLTFVSTTKKGEVVDLPFFHCVPALSNYAVEYREPNVLIRGLNAAEMGLLISGVKQSLKRI
jgi:hypothetical protein